MKDNIVVRQFYKYTLSVNNQLYIISNGGDDGVISFRQFEELNSASNEGFMEFIDSILDDADNFKWVGIELPNGTKILFKLKGDIEDMEYKINDTQEWNHELKFSIVNSDSRVFDDNDNLIN